MHEFKDFYFTSKNIKSYIKYIEKMMSISMPIQSFLEFSDSKLRFNDMVRMQHLLHWDKNSAVTHSKLLLESNA